jgi:hypothetical protein
MDVGRGHHRNVRRDLGRRPERSADLLRQLDDDPLRPADVAEAIDVFVVLHLANELPAVGAQASYDGVDVVDCECEMADARGVRRRVPVAAPPRSTGPSPCSLSPSSTKKAVAAARSSTTMPAWSMRWMVMRSTVAERRPQPQRLSVADRLVGTRRPIGLKRPAIARLNRVVAGYASLWRTLSETTVPT